MTIPHMYRTSSGSIIRRLACAANDNAAAPAAIRCADGQHRDAVNGCLPVPGARLSHNDRPSMRVGGLSDRILAADGHDAACRANIRSGMFVPCRCDLCEPDDPARVVGIAIAFGQLSCPRGLALPKGIQHRLSRLAEAGDGAALAVRDWLARNGYLASADMAASGSEPGNRGRSATSRTASGRTDAARQHLPLNSRVDKSHVDPSRMDHSRPTTPRISPLRKRGDA